MAAQDHSAFARAARGRHPAIGAAAAGLGLALALEAQAQADTAVRYSAPSGCPGDAGFREALAARVSHTEAEELEITVRADDQGWTGELAIRFDVDRGTARRQLRGDTCDELVAALALVAAVLLDLGAPPRRAGRASSTDPPRALAGPKVVATGAVAEVRRSRTQIYAGAGISAIGRGAGIHLETPVFVEVGMGAREGTGALLRLGFHRAGATATAEEGGADFTWTLWRAEACPLHWPRRARSRLWLCGLAEGGVVGASAFGVDNSRSETRAALAAGVGLRVDLGLGRARVSFDGAVTAPVLRHHFYFSPDSPVLEVPRVQRQAGINLAWRFR